MIYYLSTSGVADWLGIAPPTVRRLLRKGELRVVAETQDGMHLFDADEVYELAKRRAKQPSVIYPPILDRSPPTVPEEPTP